MKKMPAVVQLVGTGTHPRRVAAPFRTRHTMRFGDIVIRPGRVTTVRGRLLEPHLELVANYVEAGSLRVQGEGRSYSATELRNASFAEEEEVVTPRYEDGDDKEKTEKKGKEKEEEIPPPPPPPEDPPPPAEDAEDEPPTEGGETEVAPTETGEETKTDAGRITLPEGWEKLNKTDLTVLAAEVGVPVAETDTKKLIIQNITAAVK